MDNKLTFAQSVIASIVSAVVVGLIVVTFLPVAKETTQYVNTGSPAGTSFNQAKVAMVNWTLTATSSSVYNGDASDRYVQSFTLACGSVATSQTVYTGAGLIALIVQSSTSTTAASSAFVLSNTNYVFNSQVSTSTGDLYVSSTTPGLLSSSNAFARRWAAGTYLDFASNATNTAACTVGVNYIAS